MSLPALRLIGKGRVTTGPTAAECSGQTPLAVRSTAGISGRLDNPKGTGKGAPERKGAEKDLPDDLFKFPWKDRVIDTRTLLKMTPQIVADLTKQIKGQLQEELDALEEVVQFIESIQPGLSCLVNDSPYRKMDNGGFAKDFTRVHDILEQTLEKVRSLKREFESERVKLQL